MNNYIIEDISFFEDDSGIKIEIVFKKKAFRKKAFFMNTVKLQLAALSLSISGCSSSYSIIDSRRIKGIVAIHNEVQYVYDNALNRGNNSWL